MLPREEMIRRIFATTGKTETFNILKEKILNPLQEAINISGKADLKARFDNAVNTFIKKEHEAAIQSMVQAFTDEEIGELYSFLCVSETGRHWMKFSLEQLRHAGDMNPNASALILELQQIGEDAGF